VNWVDACVKNKLVVYVAAIALCIVGIFCLSVIPITPFQPVSINHIHVSFSYSGANANSVQAQVTGKVVNALIGTSNIDHINAFSYYGGADIDITLNSNDNVALLQTQLQIMQAISASHLPQSVPQPKITVETGSSSLISVGITSDKLSLFRIQTFLQSTIYPALSSLPGVTALPVFQDPPTVKIKLIPEKIVKYHLNLANVYNIINSSYKVNPLGNLYLNQQTYGLNINNNINSLQKFGDLVIGYATHAGNPIFLKDIAAITFSPKSVIPSYYMSYNGKPTSAVELATYSLANPFKISKLTRAYMHKLEQHLPSGMKIDVAHDTAPIMTAAIHDVIWTIVIAAILVLLVVLMFLGHFKTTLIPIATIPICLLGSIVALTLFGYSVNLITLLALVLAIGLVVDDAIVVIENISRYLAQGMQKHEAVVHGTYNIALTTIGITLTLLAVYLPIAFCSGMFITFLKAFAIPLAAAVFISGIVALTLTPVMSIYLISAQKANAYQNKFNDILTFIIKQYQKFLKHVLNVPYFSLMIAAILIAVSGYFALRLPKRFFPIDPSSFVVVHLYNNGQDNVASLRQKAQLFRQFFTGNKIEYYTVIVNRDQVTGQVNGVIEIKYKEKYLHQTIGLTDQINKYIKQNHLTSIRAKMRNFSNAGSEEDLSFYLYGDDVNLVDQAARHLTDLMKQSKMFATVTNNINLPRKQISFNINTIKAAKFGLYQNQIATMLSCLYGGATLDNNFSIAGLSVPVVVQLNYKSLKDPQSIEQLQIFSPTTNKFYPLSGFVALKTIAKPNMVSTLNDKPTVEINADLAKGAALSQAITYTNKLIQKNAPSMQYLYIGKAKNYLEGSKLTPMIIGMGSLCIYLLLVVLFGSLIDPFIVLFTIPFSVIGGAISLYLIGGSINLYSILGLITLVGLITKHGVLIVRFANHELEKGANIIDAIMTATHHRFRPIIMTTLVMSLGAVPLVFSQGYMYVARRDLGITVIGGLLIGTLFSLLLVPLIYSLVKRETSGKYIS